MLEKIKQVYQVKSPIWSGPLDLLVDLIKSSKLNICDISLQDLTDKYLSTLKLLEKLNVEITSNFLVMASTLILIKSRELLPEDEKEVEEIEEAKKNLIESLLTYEKYKSASKQLLSRENDNKFLLSKNNKKGKINLIKAPASTKNNLWQEIELKDLLKAINKVIDLKKFHVNLKNIKLISISERINFINERLADQNSLPFKELFLFNSNKREIVVTFWALLELYKNSKISLKQKDVFSEIFVFKKDEN